MKNKILNLVLLIGVILFAWLYFTKPDVIKEVTKTEVKYDTITKVIDNTKPTEIKKVYIKVSDTVHEVVNDTVTVEKITYKDREVNQYTYLDSLENGIIHSRILADKIYQRDVTLQTFNKTTTTETTLTVSNSELFLGGMLMSDFNKSIRNISLNALYKHKRGFLILGGVGYDVYNHNSELNRQHLTFNFGFAVKL